MSEAKFLDTAQKSCLPIGFTNHLSHQENMTVE